MKFIKKEIAEMEKAYSVNTITIDGDKKFVVGTEKLGPLNLFNLDGDLEETIFEDFGGVMSIIPVPNQKNSFLTTYRFYSPNDGYNAKIVNIRKVNSNWEMSTLTDLPFVHRFDIFKSGGEYYLLACTIKSGFEFKNDWNQPGKIYSAKLPEDVSVFNDENQLKLEIIKENLTRNHGFSKVKGENEYALITSDEGVFRVVPPLENNNWEIEKILDQSTSDSLLYDLDGDGKDELVTFSEFHGDHLDIYKEVEKDDFEKIYSYKKPLRFLHSAIVEVIDEKPVLFIGQRGGDMDLFSLIYNHKSGTFDREDIDSGIGVANLTSYFKDGIFHLVSANRETNTVTLYKLEDK